ncbi:MAG: glutathione-regulated potassium-efflux system ancillary protein KefC [Alphaproteobacteria bacterium]|jgi:glutathione-regulated potassium-efflux system ancillary protein KefC
MDFLWIFVAFSLGFIAQLIRLPPLLGYLVAGFALHALGVEPTPHLQTLAELGVTLLLFTVGLKLDIQKTLKPEILISTFGHMAIFLTISITAFTILGNLSLVYFEGIDFKTTAIICFALSFSSTVVSVKALEEKGEMLTSHGQLVLSVLVLQDIAAVVFLSSTAENLPSIYAIALLGLPFLTPLFNTILKHSGHGEILALAGFFMAFLGAWLFESLGLKADLGALAFGIMLSRHYKAIPLAKALLHFKDIFLIGFFLSIGFYALPTWDMFIVAALMTLSLPIKGGLFFILFTKLRLRGRTAFLSSAELTNYSEFGLIVIFMSIQQDLISKDWLVIISLSTALSFMISSILNKSTHTFYTKWKTGIKRFECSSVLLKDTYESPKDAKTLIVGMGRVGSGAYEAAIKESNGKVCGVDFNVKKINYQRSLGRNVIRADVEDPDFWEHINIEKIKYIMLALPSAYDVIETVKLLKIYKFKGKITSIAKFEDDHQKLIDAGLDTVFNFYSEAGVGLAEETFREISKVSKV